MKKITSLLMAALIVIFSAVSAIPVFAAQPEISVSLTSAEGYPGDTVSIDLNVDRNDGIYSLWYLMYYDKDALSLEGVSFNEELTEAGDFYATAQNVPAEGLTGPVAQAALAALDSQGVDVSAMAYKVIQFEAKSINEDVTFTGRAATFTFKILDGAQGSYEVSLIPVEGNIINCNFDDLAVSTDQGTVTVKEKDVTPGDAGKLALDLSSDDGYVGDTVDLDLSIIENDGVFGFWYLLCYPKDALELTSVQYAPALTALGEFYDTPNNASEGDLAGVVAPAALKFLKDNDIDTSFYAFKVIFFEANDHENDVTYTGDAATLSFRIKDEAEAYSSTGGTVSCPVFLIPVDGNEINCAGEDLETEPVVSSVGIIFDEIEVGDVMFNLTDATGFAGDEVTMDLNVTDNPGIFSLVTLLYYDADVFTLTDFIYNDEVLAYGEFVDTPANLSEAELAGVFPPKALAKLKELGITTSDKNYKVIYFEGTSLTENADFEGTYATLRFKIAEDATPGDYEIGLQCVFGYIINVEGQDVDALYNPGTITVKEPINPEPQPEPEPEPQPEPEPEPAPEPKPAPEDEPAPAPAPSEPANPSTGDNVNLLFLIALLATAGLFIGVWSYYLRRKADRAE